MAICLLSHKPSEGYGQDMLDTTGGEKDKVISDDLLWKQTHGRASVGSQSRPHIDQLGEDTGCCAEDLPGTMNDREGMKLIKKENNEWKKIGNI